VTSNLGRWAKWNGGYDVPAPYGDSVTYKLGAEFLEPCATLEDWGSGRGWFETLCPRAIAIDGSPSAHTTVLADLTRYTSCVEGIFMRHVLEHDPQWRAILSNAVGSFTKRLCLILFTPLVARTQEIAFNQELGVPDISFAVKDIEWHFDRDVHTWTRLGVDTPTQYGHETCFFVELK
jgi:hypothetical protein